MVISAVFGLCVLVCYLLSATSCIIRSPVVYCLLCIVRNIHLTSYQNIAKETTTFGLFCLVAMLMLSPISLALHLLQFVFTVPDRQHSSTYLSIVDLVDCVEVLFFC